MLELKKNQRIGSYIITSPLSSGEKATARAKDKRGDNYFLRVYKSDSPSAISKAEDQSKKILSTIDHPRVLKFIEEISLKIEGENLTVDVFEFIGGESIRELVEREGKVSVYRSKQIILSLIELFEILHSQKNPILMRSLSPSSVMLDYSLPKPSPIVIHMRDAHFLSEKSVEVVGAPLFAHISAINSPGSISSDIFSIGALFYYLIFGVPPWFSFKLFLNSPSYLKKIESIRKKKLFLDGSKIFEFDENILQILSICLLEPQNISLQEIKEKLSLLPDLGSSSDDSERIHKEQWNFEISKKNSKSCRGGGFADVAGMEEIKLQLQSDVIDVLRNKGRAEELGLHLPNGLLFYGPPGCGKTFFAKKFAEEVGCTFIYVSCSDIASPYIHGGQEKIAALFKTAREKSPTIIFFDEIEAMVRDRREQTNASEAGEVNEFLTQLNNSGHDNLIVIGATNRPDLMDPAALRAGRFEYKYYIPLPDLETRKELFRISLLGRRHEKEINLEKLSHSTEGYVGADISLIVEKAARRAFMEKRSKITMGDLEIAVRDTKSSVDSNNPCDVFDPFSSGKTTKKIGFI